MRVQTGRQHSPRDEFRRRFAIGDLGQERRYDDGILTPPLQRFVRSNEAAANRDRVPGRGGETAGKPFRGQADRRLLAVVNHRLQRDLGTSHSELSSEANIRDVLKWAWRTPSIPLAQAQRLAADSSSGSEVMRAALGNGIGSERLAQNTESSGT